MGWNHQHTSRVFFLTSWSLLLALTTTPLALLPKALGTYVLWDSSALKVERGEDCSLVRESSFKLYVEFTVLRISNEAMLEMTQGNFLLCWDYFTPLYELAADTSPFALAKEKNYFNSVLS